MNYLGDNSQATGRDIRCVGCRKPLPPPTIGQRVITCPHCNTEEAVPVSLRTELDLSLRIDSPSVDIESPPILSSATQDPANSRLERESMDDDDFEFKLEPEPNRPSSTEASEVLTVATEDLRSASTISQEATDDFVLGPLSSPSSAYPKNPVGYDGFGDIEARTDRARASYNETSGLYPRERHYPTLESMQRLYYVFGYACILITFPYLAFRLVYVFVMSDDQLLQNLAEFSEFAVPLMFGCVALAATLFAASEGIKLAMDIQDNTLRTANRNGRHKMD